MSMVYQKNKKMKYDLIYCVFSFAKFRRSVSWFHRWHNQVNNDNYLVLEINAYYFTGDRLVRKMLYQLPENDAFYVPSSLSFLRTILFEFTLSLYLLTYTIATTFSSLATQTFFQRDTDTRYILLREIHLHIIHDFEIPK